MSNFSRWLSKRIFLFPDHVRKVNSKQGSNHLLSRLCMCCQNYKVQVFLQRRCCCTKVLKLIEEQNRGRKLQGLSHFSEGFQERAEGIGSPHQSRSQIVSQIISRSLHRAPCVVPEGAEPCIEARRGSTELSAPTWVVETKMPRPTPRPSFASSANKEIKVFRTSTTKKFPSDRICSRHCPKTLKCSVG